MLTIDEQNQVQKWLEAEKNGDPFPVDFELAWQMAGYAYKQDACNNVKNNLEKGIDFLGKSLKNGRRGRSSVSFELTCDGFKHFCLMAKTEKGREIRQYFIEAEKALKRSIPICQSLAIENEQLKKASKAVIQERKPFFVYCDGKKYYMMTGKTKLFEQPLPDLTGLDLEETAIAINNALRSMEAICEAFNGLSKMLTPVVTR